MGPLALCCMSHSPLLNLPGPSQDLLDDIESALGQARGFVAAYDPELVVIFSPDHYNGFFYKTMPPFCIGTAAQGVGDYGTHAGPLNVPPASQPTVRGPFSNPVSTWRSRPAWTSTTGRCNRCRSCSVTRQRGR